MVAPKEQEDLLDQLAGLATDVRRWVGSVEHRISGLAELIEQSAGHAATATAP